jgi:hypothetical protein
VVVEVVDWLLEEVEAEQFRPQELEEVEEQGHFQSLLVWGSGT